MTTCASCGKPTKLMTRKATKRIPSVDRETGTERAVLMQYMQVVGIPMWCDACLVRYETAAVLERREPEEAKQMSLFGGTE